MIEKLPTLAGCPLWVAYAEDDEVAELTEGSKLVVDALAGSQHLTTRAYRLGWQDGAGPHVRTCDHAYAEPGLYRWFLEQCRVP